MTDDPREIRLSPGARKYLLANPETRAIIERTARDILALYRSLPWYHRVAVRILGFFRR